jgi:hypothetical protein
MPEAALRVRRLTLPPTIQAAQASQLEGGRGDKEERHVLIRKRETRIRICLWQRHLLRARVFMALSHRRDHCSGRWKKMATLIQRMKRSQYLVRS